MMTNKLFHLECLMKIIMQTNFINLQLITNGKSNFNSELKRAPLRCISDSAFYFIWS